MSAVLRTMLGDPFSAFRMNPTPPCWRGKPRSLRVTEERFKANDDATQHILSDHVDTAVYAGLLLKQISPIRHSNDAIFHIDMNLRRTDARW